jgi:hypothetical protein
MALRLLVTGLISAITLSTPALAQEQAQTIAECPINMHCVEMELSAERGHITVQQREDDAGYTVFAVRVRGTMGAATEASHQLLIRGYTGGLACTNVGQAKVPVVGNGPGNRPQILTDRGVLTLADSTVSVGCERCARVRDLESDSIIAAFRSPGLDLALVGLRPDSLALTASGALVVQRQGKWLDISSPGRFRLVPLPGTGKSRHRLDLLLEACT